MAEVFFKDGSEGSLQFYPACTESRPGWRSQQQALCSTTPYGKSGRLWERGYYFCLILTASSACASHVQLECPVINNERNLGQLNGAGIMNLSCISGINMTARIRRSWNESYCHYRGIGGPLLNSVCNYSDFYFTRHVKCVYLESHFRVLWFRTQITVATDIF